MFWLLRAYKSYVYIVVCWVCNSIMSLKKLLLLFSLQVVSDSFMTLWTVAHQASLSKGFPRQEYWSGLLFPSLENLPDPGVELQSPAWQAFFTSKPPGKSLYLKWITNKDLLYSTWNSVQHYVAACMGGGLRGGWFHVYVWLSPFTVHLKLPQYC